MRFDVLAGLKAVAVFALTMSVALFPVRAQDVMVKTAAIAPQQLSGTDDEHYTLGSGDKVKVTVYGEDDLGGEFAIDGSGHIQLPLVGQVKAAGLTLHQFVASVTAALQNGYLKDPKVNAQVLNYRPFYIIGEVNKPGEYPYENGLTILRAVALAGGYTYRANDNRVYVRRVNDSDENSMPADSRTRISPGDIVRVPERIF
jgi:protein involved in polysaccharide export with SLBB domain